MTTLSFLMKPVSHLCNLDCPYCFYQRVDNVYSNKTKIDAHTLDILFAKAFGQRADRLTFTWQGGEPMLLGLETFKNIIALQKKYKQDFQIVENTLQTNGTLINEEWAQFLKQENFLVGVSVDGPREIHDRFRFYHNKDATFDHIYKNLLLLQKYDIPFNILTLLTANNISDPKKLYTFYQENNFHYLQFIPYFEQHPRLVDGFSPEDFSINGEQLAHFYKEIFDLWYPNDMTRVSIRFFEDLLLFLADGQLASCTWADQCLSYIVIEHNGDCYPCDFYVYPEWKLGNIVIDDLPEILFGDKRMRFAKQKMDLPGKCRACPYVRFCHGDCPMFRRKKKKRYEPSIFCASIKEMFFTLEPIMPELMTRVQQIRQDFQAGKIQLSIH